MSHAITIGGLLGVLIGIGALICLGIGAIAIFAGGMSDAPEAGGDATGTGCIVAVVGAALLALSMWLLA